MRTFRMTRYIALLLGLIASSNSVAAEKPNFVLFLTDDQGWTDTSIAMMPGRPSSGSSSYQTPALERMAARGMLFSNAYACAPTCTPSRAGFQFGKTPCRLRQTIVHDVLAKERGIDCKNEISLAQMVKRADPDYVTAHFGKWGFHPRSPEHAGYDETDGDTNNGEGDYLDVKRRTPLPDDDPKRIFSVARRANEFVEKQASAGRPFFLQVSHYAVHVGHAARPGTLANYPTLPPGEGRRSKEAGAQHRNNAVTTYAAMIEDLDKGLSLLLDKLTELGIEGNTYVIFTSDNGGGVFQQNPLLRGGKATLWEGGIRVPTVVVGPGVKKKAVCDVPIAGWDLYATVNDLIGGMPLPAEYDGGSLRQLFKEGNKGSVQRSTPELIFHFPWYGGTLPMSTIRDGDDKLVMNLHTGETRLYDLRQDLGETTDLSAAMPEKAERLRERLRSYLEAVDAEGLDDMFDSRMRELTRYLQREQQRANPDADAIKRHNRALEATRSARANTEWR